MLRIRIRYANLEIANRAVFFDHQTVQDKMIHVLIMLLIVKMERFPRDLSK